LVATVFLSGLLLICSSGVFVKQGYTVLKSQNGALIVWNDSTVYFTLELPGTSFAHVKTDGLAFLVNGHLVQVIPVDITKFSESSDSPEHVLEKHREWEIKHWEKSIKQKVISELIEIDKDSGSEAYMWQITWPQEAAQRLDTQAVRNLWATRVVGDRVVSISMPVMKKDDESEVMSLFFMVSRSFKGFSEPIDPMRVQSDIRE
jgi:hypothetical protein